MPRGRPPPRAARARWAWIALVLLAYAGGLVMRGLVGSSSLGTLDADEAVWGLMSVHARDGEPSAFYWGQGYGGTAESLLTVPLVSAFGHSVTAIRLVPVLLTAIAAVLVWRVGRRMLGEPAATAAGLLVWVWPAYLVWKSVRAHGFYASGLVVVALVLLLALRLAERRSRLDAALLGLALGIGWWLTPQTAVVAVPALAWLTWSRPGLWRDGLVAAPAFLVGALPWLGSNLAHDWWSLSADWGGASYLERVRTFAAATLPMELGVRVPFSSEWLGGPVVGPILYLALVAALAWCGYRSRGTPLALASVCLAAYPLLHAISPYTWVSDEPRYVVLLTPVLALLLASLLRRRLVAAAALLAAAALSASGLALLARSPEYERRADGMDVPRDVRSLVDELERRGLDRVYADYWVAYRIDFESAERIVAAEARLATVAWRGAAALPPPPAAATDIRHPPYDEAVRRLRTPPYVAVRATADDRRLREVLGGRYRRIPLGGFALFVPQPSG